MKLKALGNISDRNGSGEGCFGDKKKGEVFEVLEERGIELLESKLVEKVEESTQGVKEKK